jgi:hypothetical protein
VSEETTTHNAETEQTTSSSTETPATLNEGQLAARRANAKKSTGPRTLVGNLRSSQNALKDGRHRRQNAASARSLYNRMEQLGENPAEFAEIEDGLRTSFLPSNEIQKMLVHEIASLEWQRQRLERAQAALFHALAEAGPKAPPDESIVSGLHLELLREISDVTSQYDFYLREHTDLTPTMRDECLAPNSKQRALLIYLGMIDRQITKRFACCSHYKNSPQIATESRGRINRIKGTKRGLKRERKAPKIYRIPITM